MKTTASDSRKIKVVRIIARLNIGGPAIHACLLHQKLYPEFDTILATGRLDAGEGDMSYLLASKRGVFSMPSMSRPVRVGSDFATVFRLWRLLRRERPDVVHTHTAKAGTVGRVAAILAGVPVVLHTYHGHIFRGGYFGPAMTRVFLQIERILSRFTTRIVTVSESQVIELADKFKVAPRNKFVVISNGYDLSRYPDPRGGATLRKEWRVGDDETLVVWAGRMVPVKNVELLAEIVRLAREHRKLKFVIIGDGSERRNLEAAVVGLSNVRLVGWARDMAAVWSAADIALLTSRNEGTPSSLIEAMAAAKPIVTTAVGGVADLLIGNATSFPDGLEQFANGFTFDSPAAAVHAMTRLATDADLRRSMGENGRSFAVRNYSADRLLGDIRNLYYELVGRVIECPQSVTAFHQRA